MTMTTSKSKRGSSSSSGASKGKTAKRRKPKGGPDAHRTSCLSWSEAEGVVALGLDLSLQGTGLVVVAGGRLLHHERIKTSPVPDRVTPRPLGWQAGLERFEGSVEQRIEHIAHRVRVADQKFNIDVCAIEGHSYASKGNTAQLHEMHGVIKNALTKLGIVWIVRSPDTVKKHATGDGHADKLTMIHYAKKLGFKEAFNDDEADAFHLARYVLDFPPEQWLARFDPSML